MSIERKYEDVVRDTLDNLEQVVSYCKRVKCEECVFKDEDGACLLGYIQAPRGVPESASPYDWDTAQIEKELLNWGSSTDDEIANASLAELSVLRDKIDKREKKIWEENKDELLNAVGILKQTCEQYSDCKDCPLRNYTGTGCKVSDMEMDTIEERLLKD